MNKLMMDEWKMKRLIERMKGQMDISWSKEEQVLEQFGIKDGHSILEVGSGPGYITERLLHKYPASRITSIEIEPYYVQYAQHNMAPEGKDRVTVMEGDILDHRLPLGQFDVAIARLVFQHLPDPELAARNILDLLKPGGKLIVLDVDDAIWGIIDPVIPELQYILNQHAKEQSSQGGNRFIGRQLWHLLQSNGYADLDLKLIAAHSDEIGIRSFLPQVDADEMRTMVDNGFVTEEEVAAVEKGVAAFLDTAHPYALLIMMAVCGSKPNS
ncbi:class I SAM-dependent methyltransferase [Paenibacillus apiarius]|uniref:Methyltransferase domain-containing protein n=1 Tax=Paenibacillus apiarius TaxID=46240 RepID=A0ABT4E0J6_9BACL|nr:class I SAM-dependent methyltransferase [Paenibacillus apiarius]MBN3527354.1 methyltransferase domain-containing protein [Paenibacillus apiarius]MCY9517877.1 methyltransferase domain-containing protein [Paenibacillus apiarius]MCY9523122.1 methyltransferase domain-containing protein [Paenibacillus apiarius]MCY9553924.1 methyltransferase domain-containing protein [Paenibacillus apiarius]MCY9559936.1 methyltransferase domain-containing protein [Paenibacillus apiarius]